MKGHEENISATLSEFAALGPADRKAVEALLTPAERRVLEKLIRRADRHPSQRAGAVRRDPAQPFSPWLAKRLRKLVEPQDRPGAPQLTHATQEVLSSLLTRQAVR